MSRRIGGSSPAPAGPDDRRRSCAARAPPSAGGDGRQRRRDCAARSDRGLRAQGRAARSTWARPIPHRQRQVRRARRRQRDALVGRQRMVERDTANVLGRQRLTPRESPTAARQTEVDVVGDDPRSDPAAPSISTRTEAPGSRDASARARRAAEVHQRFGRAQVTLPPTADSPGERRGSRGDVVRTQSAQSASCSAASGWRARRPTRCGSATPSSRSRADAWNGYASVRRLYGGHATAAATRRE
jgi:hypothetical protein